MMQQNPWDAFPAVEQQQDPVIARDPYKINAEARAEEDQRLQREANERAAAADARAAGADARAAEAANRAAKADAMGSESERTAGFLTGRIKDAVSRLGQGALKDRSALAPTFGVEAVRKVAGDTAANYTTDAERQIVRAAQIDILDAALTLGTGAAYNKEQLEGYRESYFPQLGDAPETVASKNQALRQLLENARVKAGRSAPDIEAAMAMLDQLNQPEQGQAREPEMRGGVPVGSNIQFGMDGGNDGPFDRQAYLERQYGLKPGDEAKIVSFWNANAGNTQLTPEAVLGWYAQNGLNPPSGEDLAQGVEWARSGDRFSGLNTSQAEAEYVSKLDEAIGQQGIRPEDVSTTAGTGLAQGILLQGADEISGIGGGIRAAISGEDPISAYQGERDIYRRIAERGQAENPGTALASEIGGSLVTGGVGFSGVRNVPQAFRAGAQMGGITGFNSGEGMGNSLAMLPIGAVAGGSLAAAGQKAMPYVANALSRVAPQRAPASADQLNIIAAGDRRGVPIRQADVRPEVRNQRGVVRTGERGGQIIRRTEEEDIASLESAVANDLGGASMPQDKESIGDTLQSAVDRFTEVSGKKAGAQYTRAHKLAGSAKIPPAQAIKAVDEQIAELTQSGAKSNKGLIQYLTDIRDDLSVDGGMTIDALRSQRTNMRGQINERNLTSTDAERRIAMVLDAASADISRALSTNPRALQAFRQADQAWADRSRFLKQVGEKLIGPENNRKSGRAAASQIDSWLKGDFGRARRLWAEMDNGERDALRATVVQSLGRNGRGEFSLGAFLSHTGSGKASSLSPKAARLILGDDGMRALEDLRVIAGAKEAAANETNVSRTGNVVQATGRGLRNLMLASLGFSAGDVSGAVVAPAAGNFLSRLGEERAARMLVNPDFTKWLRTLPNTGQPAAINAQFQRLNSIAARSAIPSFQQDVRALQQHLMESFAQSPTRAAASEEEQN